MAIDMNSLGLVVSLVIGASGRSGNESGRVGDAGCAGARWLVQTAVAFKYLGEGEPTSANGREWRNNSGPGSDVEVLLGDSHANAKFRLVSAQLRRTKRGPSVECRYAPWP